MWNNTKSTEVKNTIVDKTPVTHGMSPEAWLEDE